MAALKRCLPLLVVIAACGACTPPVKETGSTPQGGPRISAFLLVDRWHASIAIKISDIPADLVPERHDFPEAQYLESGWGDWDFYQEPTFSLGYALKALFFPTKTVMHVVGFRGPLAEYAPYREIIKFDLHPHDFERLVAYIDESFARTGGGAAAALGRGLYGDSRFYPARGAFHLFNTCNTWAARALQAAGYSISSAITADTLASEARDFGDML